MVFEMVGDRTVGAPSFCDDVDARILHEIAADPGVRFWALKDRLGMAPGTLRYRMTCLYEAGLVSYKKGRNLWQIYPKE